MIKKLADSLFIDIENEEEKFSIINIDYWPSLNNDQDTYQRHYSDRTYSYNRNPGQAMFLLSTDSVESMYNLYIYLKRCGWKQVRILNDGYIYEEYFTLRKYLTLEEMTKRISESGGDWGWYMFNCENKLLSVTVEVPKSLYPKFKKDLLNLPTYKFTWSAEDVSANERIKVIIK